jgi:hypothetical protein
MDGGDSQVAIDASAADGYNLSPRPPAVRAHSRQNRTHIEAPTGVRWAKKATPGALHRRKCQQFWLEHSQIPRERDLAAAFISSFSRGRAERRRSLPSRVVARRSCTESSALVGSDGSLIAKGY